MKQRSDLARLLWTLPKPRKDAKTMSATYETRVGCSVDVAIAEMRDLADKLGTTVRTEFNGTEIVVAPGADLAAVEAEWRSALARRSETYRNSPEGRAVAEARSRVVAERQAEVDRLVAEMHSTLNAEDVPAVIRWFDQFTLPADDVDVHKPAAEIVEWFAHHGYQPNVNTGSAYDADDPENVARYLIGQALDGIRTLGSPHPMFKRFAAEWLAHRDDS